MGNKTNDLSFLFTADNLDTTSQPMQFANSIATNTTAGSITAVTGAYLDKYPSGKNRVILGATGIDHSEQLNLKFKAAYDIAPTVKIAYTLGIWNLDSHSDVASYIKYAAGNDVFNDRVTFNGKNYDVSGFNNPNEAEATHIMQALDLKSNTKRLFDWQFTFSDYDYQKDKNSTSNVPSSGTVAAGNPYLNKVGRVVDQAGTGWTVFDARGTLRPVDNHGDQHTIDSGYYIDAYKLRSDTNNTADWSVGNKGTLFGTSRGETATHAIYLQDKWQLDPKWALTLGARQEHWEATDGRNQTTISAGFQTSAYSDKLDDKFSPKISISFEPLPAWGFRASVGQAYRFPTVSELYQQVTSGTSLIQNNPDLKTEEVISGEFTAERRFANGLMRASLFTENKFDALVSQTIPTGPSCIAKQCTFIHDVDHVRTGGIELSTEWQDLLINGLDLLGSLTLTEAEILRNEANPTLEGNKPLRIPKSMFKAVATYHQGNHLTYSLAARYSGRQYNTLDNSDINPDTFGGVSKFFIMDVKANYNFTEKFTASIGIDNLNNYKAYAFHPYPKRTGYLQLKLDY